MAGQVVDINRDKFFAERQLPTVRAIGKSEADLGPGDDDSLHAVSSAPCPITAPSIAAMTGTRRFSIAVNVQLGIGLRFPDILG